MLRHRVLAGVLPLLVAGAVAVPVVDSWGGTRTATTAAVSGPGGTATVGSGTDPTLATTAAAGIDGAAVVAAVDAAGGTADGALTVVVLDGDGDTLVSSPTAVDEVHTASLVKLLVVQQLLQAGDPSTEDLALMAAAIRTSDDDAMNRLWVDHDGAALVTAAAAEFGLTGTAPPTEAGQWGETTTTATDLATVLSSYPDHLGAADAVLLTGWLQGTTATAADGFDQTFGLLSLGLDGTAAKQGWMCCIAGTRNLHSVGVLADGRVVVLLGSFPSGTSWAQAQAAVDAAASAAVTGTQSGS